MIWVALAYSKPLKIVSLIINSINVHLDWVMRGLRIPEDTWDRTGNRLKADGIPV